jgi:tRNA(adenine34) deaminase
MEEVVCGDDLRFMREALAEAQRAFDAGEVPIGAVAVENGVVTARGYNRVEELSSVSGHAEFQVLKELERLYGDWRMQNITLYVTKEPCFMCAGMIVNARFKRVVFGLDDPKTGGCGGSINIPAHQDNLWHPEVTGGILADEAKQLIRTFFQKRRKEQTKQSAECACTDN